MIGSRNPVQVWLSVVPTFSIKDEAEKLAARKALCEPDGATAQKMKNVEALVAGCTAPFYCGDAATLADIQLYCWLGFVRTGYVTRSTS